METEAGTLVGGYRLGPTIGAGSMGVVYVADDVHLERRVAVKVLNGELAQDDRFRDRFLQESRLAASLDHPNVVPIFTAGEDGGALFLAMRLVEGTDLRALLRSRHHLEPARAVVILGQVAAALDAAHAVGLVHRDVKPANVLVAAGPPEHAYLCDFGLARVASSPGSLTGERSFVGTLSYVAPEQIEVGEVGPAADQYALACMLFECLTGVRPFQRDSEVQTIFAHLHEEPPRAAAVDPGLPEALDEVLTRALAKDPGERYGSCRELVAAAAAALGVATPVIPSGGASVAHRRRVRSAAIAAILAGAVAIAAAAVATRALGGSDEVVVAPHALAVLDRDSGDLEWQLPFDTDPDYVVVEGRIAYVGLSGEGNVATVDLDARRVVNRIPLPEGQWVGPVLGGVMWSGGQDDSVIPIDLRYGTPGKRIELDRTGDVEATEAWVAVGEGSVWAAYGSPPRVARIDPRTRKVTATILLHSDFWGPFGAVTVGDGAVWATDRGSGDLWRIDPATNQVVARGSLKGPWIEDLSAVGGYLWASRTDDAGVYRIDPTLSVSRFVPTGVWPYAVSAGEGEAWVANRNDGTVTGVEPLTGDTRTLDVGGAPVNAVATGDELVVALAERPADPYAGLSGSVGTIFTSGDPLFPSDPAFGEPSNTARIAIHDATGLRLVRQDDADGDGVQRLVGDGADLPVVTDGGRTWRFHVRDGYQFSPPSGERVTARVFRDSIERALSPDWGESTPFPDYLDDVRGADAFRKGKARHIAGLEIQGDDLVFRLVRPARDLGARLALQPYAAVPTGTPVVRDGVVTPIPSAGPYYLAAHADNAYVVLRRNPSYPGPRKPRIDAFVWRLLVASEPGVARVLDGDGDLVFQGVDQNTGSKSPALAAGGPLERRFAGGSDPQYLRPGVPFSFFLRFNTLRPPFSDIRLRRAVNLAVDRAELAAFWDGRPADLMLPPGIAAHRPQGEVYPLDGPLLGPARRLAGGVSRTVTLAADPRASQQAIARALKRQLARIGLRVRIVTDWDRRQNASRYDLVLDTWLLDYLDPAVSFPALLDPVASGYDQFAIVDPPVFTDARWIRRIRATDAIADPEARDTAYARLDRDLATRAIPFAVLGHGSAALFSSARLGCAKPIGLWGAPDLAELCLRDA